MAAQRPVLSIKLPTSEFLAWYWLKDELLDFCKRNKLRAAGSKPELTDRIARLLSGQEQVSNEPRPATLSSRSTPMPTAFNLNTVIGTNWRCNPSLGAFLKKHCGPRFRFNAATRNFIHAQTGRTLADAVQCFKQSVAPGAPKQPIIAQNEYNRHTREFFLANPNANRQAAIDAWWAKRNQPKAK
jgi:SAP domain-containing new25/Domain of unknown function (DUF6434)